MAEQGRLRTRFGRLVRGLLVTALVGVVVTAAGHRLLMDRLNDEIRTHIKQLLVQHYPGLDIHLQSARRLPGRGIEIRDLSLGSSIEETEYRELVRIDEILIRCSTDLTELLSGRPCIQEVVVRRMKLRAARHRDGRWNIASLFPLPKLGGELPRLTFENASVEIYDLGKCVGGGWALRDINLQATAQPQGDGTRTLQLTATFEGDHFKRVQVEGGGNLDTGVLAVRGTIDNLEASPRMLAALPTEAATYLSLLQTLRTRAHLGFQVNYDPHRTQPVQWVVQGRLTEGRIDDPRLPYPVTGLVADLYCDQNRLSIENLAAQSGSSILRLTGHCDNFLSPSIALNMSATVESLALDQHLRNVLPLAIQEQWDLFDPGGVVDVELELQTRDGRIQPRMKVVCRDVTVAYHRFPYRLQRVRGVLHCSEDNVRLEEFTALAGGQTIRLAGQFRNPGPAAVGYLTVRSDGPLPLDETLLAAMPAAAQRVVRSLQPSGQLTLVHGRFERTAADQPPQTELELDVHGCAVQFERFPYPIQKIDGKLIAKNGSWLFQNLRGRHADAHLEANGRWTPAREDRPSGELVLSVQGHEVPLDDALRDAIGTTNANARQFWASLQPRGTVDQLGVTIHYDALTRHTSLEVQAQKWPPNQSVERRSISVHPTWLPLRLDDVTGTIWYADGRFELRKLTALRGAAMVELAGRGAVSPPGDWDVTLTRLTVDQLPVNDELIDALPELTRSPLRSLKLDGPVNMDGTVWLRGGNGQPLTAGWDMAIDIENGALRIQTPVEHMHGSVRLYGNKWPAGIATRGELNIDSLVYRGVQVTGLRGPFWMDGNQLVLGARSESNQANRLPRQLRAEVWGGSAVVDGLVFFKDQLPFTLDISLTGGDVARMARSFRSTQRDLTGKVFGSLHISGTQAGVHTYRGNGRVRLVDADIYELPVMVTMLSVLSLRPPATTAFTSADIDFRLNGDQVYLDRIDFIGDVISLKGQGWMDLNGQINARFYALVGRQEIQLPLIRALLAEASRSILLIQVSGTVDTPNVTRKALPELDETLQRLFPEGDPLRAGPPRGVPTLGRAAGPDQPRTR